MTMTTKTRMTTTSLSPDHAIAERPTTLTTTSTITRPTRRKTRTTTSPGFGQNVLSFIKGVVAVILILAVLIFGLRVLDEKKIVSCAWFRDHLGSVGTMLFGEAPQGENVQ